MATETLTDDDRRGLSRAKWRAILWTAMFCLIGIPGCWLGSVELQRRYGMDPQIARRVAAAISLTLGLLLFWIFAKWRGRGWLQESPHVRWVLIERAQASERRWRPFWVFFLILTAIPYLVDMTHLNFDPWTENGGWSLLIMATPLVSRLTPASKTTAPLDEALSAQRQDAIRQGYRVMIVLGITALIAGNYWPVFAVRSWPLVLIAGLLVPQVRLIALDGWFGPDE